VSGPQTPRRLARRRAFQVLYGFVFDPPATKPALEKAWRNAPAEPDVAAPGDGAYVGELVAGAWADRETLDHIIEEHSKNWKVGRIAKVELTILRVALYEMLEVADMPLRVVMNEAVELAKEFGDENSPAFVNGILDSVSKAVAEGRFDVKKDLSRKDDA